jgi:hypothetical protein
MNIRFFVSLTGVLLLAWLAATWTRHEPSQDYPVLGKGDVPISAQADL